MGSFGAFTVAFEFGCWTVVPSEPGQEEPPMFHRHDPASRTMQAEGVILERRPSALYRTRIRLVIGVKFDDGQTVEFTEELVDFCTPPANTFSERLHALIGKDVVPLSFTWASGFRSASTQTTGPSSRSTSRRCTTRPPANTCKR